VALRFKSSLWRRLSPCTTTGRGGNDTLIGGANANNGLFGDARLIYDNARGGDDTLIGAPARSTS